eukprot:1186274-Prorocentrum_minimum.AAC.2
MVALPRLWCIVGVEIGRGAGLGIATFLRIAQQLHQYLEARWAAERERATTHVSDVDVCTTACHGRYKVYRTAWRATNGDALTAS